MNNNINVINDIKLLSNKIKKYDNEDYSNYIDFEIKNKKISKILKPIFVKDYHKEVNQEKLNNSLKENIVNALKINSGTENNATDTNYNAPEPKIHEKYKLKKVIIGHNGWVRCVAIDHSNDFFITGSADRVIKIWDMPTCKLKLSLTGHVSTIRDIKISKNLSYFFSAGEDKAVKCWDMEANKVIRNFHGHLSGVYTLDIHPSLNILASGGRDATVRLWDIRTKQQITALSSHEDTVNSIIFRDCEPQLVSGGNDETIIMWDIVKGEYIKKLTHHKKSIRSLLNHNELNCFMSAGADNIKLWKCPEGMFMRNIDNKHIINSMDINDEGAIACATDNGFINLYDFESGACFQQLQTKPQPGSIPGEQGIFDIKFDVTGIRMITAECDKTIKIWDKIIYN